MGSAVSIQEPDDIPPERRAGCLPRGELSLDGVVALLREKQAAGLRVAVLCGAGISVSAGIPDFRSPGTGLYSQLEKYGLPTPESVFELGYFRDNPKPFCALAREMFPGQHKPTPAHAFLRLLQDKGLLLRCYTQNIDTLERVVGVKPDNLVEAHGTFASASCIEPDCRWRMSLRSYREEIDKGRIPRCGHMLDIRPPEVPPTAEAIASAKAEREAAAKVKDATSMTSVPLSEYMSLGINVQRAERQVTEMEAVR